MSNQPSTFRPNGIYVSKTLFRALGCLAKIQENDELRTREAMAEKILTDWIAANHPEIPKFLAEQDKRESDFIKGLGPRVPFTE